MYGNMKKKGTKIPGADDWHSPSKGAKDYDRLEGNETTYYDQKMRPGKNLEKPKKRGLRISKMRTANDAAMALSARMEDTVSHAGRKASPSRKTKKQFFKSVGYADCPK